MSATPGRNPPTPWTRSDRLCVASGDNAPCVPWPRSPPTDKSHLHDLEIGRRRPNLELARTLDDALDAGGQLLATFRPAEPDELPAGSLTLEETLRLWDDLLRRRDFLFTVTAATTGLARPASSQTQPDGAELLAAHIDLRAAHGRLDNLLGAPAVIQEATSHHRSVMGWYRSTPPGADRQRIAELAASTAGFVAFLSFDLGNYDVAARTYREAAEVAADGGDPSSIANKVGQMSRVAAVTGKHRHALTFANSALHSAGTRAHPAVRSWLHAVRAYHHATLKDARAAYTDLDRAWALLPHADDGAKPHYIGYLDAAELHKWTAHTRNALGERAPALQAAETALSEWPATHIRGSAELHIATARAHLTTGDLDHTIASLTQAATIASDTGSTRNFNTVTSIRAQLAPRRDTRAVAEFDNYLLTGLTPPRPH